MPSEYVKVCSAYGAGFYYIPGTDICLRVGGYIWMTVDFNGFGEAPNLMQTQIGTDFVSDRNENTTSFRTRSTVILDARTNTALGTLRAYSAWGFNWTPAAFAPGSPAAAAVYFERAFVQIAGFTFGFASSYFDSITTYSLSTMTSYSFQWTTLAAYTAQFGNGLSFTVSLEDGTGRRTDIGAHSGVLATTGWGTVATQTGPIVSTNFYGGHNIPDIVANLRVDQAWGSAQLSAAAHEIRLSRIAATVASDAWGYAVGGGIEVKTPTIAPGDSFSLQGVWSRGAPRFTGIGQNPGTGPAGLGHRTGGTCTTVANCGIDAVGPIVDLFDAFITPTGALELTTAWSVNAQFRHFWNPMTRSAIFAGYTRYEVGAAAGNPLTNPTGNPLNNTAYPNATIWQLGVNTIWSPVADLDVGLELLYTRLENNCTIVGGCAPVVNIANSNANNWLGLGQDIWSGLFRVRRNF